MPHAALNIFFRCGKKIKKTTLDHVNSYEPFKLSNINKLGDLFLI